jgi:hypothetical protein
MNDRSTPGNHPAVDFMVAGMQKSGTTALASFLDQHPAVCMANPKEPHLFDSPDYTSAWIPEIIDQRYVRYFEHCDAQVLKGEATPIYTLYPEIPAALRQYNPALKLIILLRDPVERAISHHAMEYLRGNERRPLWQALLLETLRLRRDDNPRALNSAMRRHSYRTRGLYSRYLKNVFSSFPAAQILLMSTDALRNEHDRTLGQVFRFLGVDDQIQIPPASVFSGHRTQAAPWFVSGLLRLSFTAERIRLNRLQRHLRTNEVGNCAR